MLTALNTAAERHRRRAARLLPQPDRLRHHARAVGPGDRRRQGAQAGRLPRHGLPGLRPGHRRGRRRRSASSSPRARTSSSRPPSPRASACTASASAPCRCCARTRKRPARVLSQLKIVIRTNYSNPPIHGGAGGRDRAQHARAARAVGEGTGRHARAHQADAPGAGRQAQGGRREAGHELHHPADRHVQLFGPDQGPDGAPAQRVRRLRHRHRPHVRGGPEQQEHRLRLRSRSRRCCKLSCRARPGIQAVALHVDPDQVRDDIIPKPPNASRSMPTGSCR